MKSFTTAILALATAVLAVAQTTANGPNAFNVPPGGYQTSAGSTVNITWTPTTQGTVSLQLRDGNAAYLNNGTFIAQNITNSGQYTWMVPQNIVRGDSYALEIIDDADASKVNFTPQFNIDSSNLYSTTASGSMTATASASNSGSAAASMTSGSMASMMSSMTESMSGMSASATASGASSISGTTAASSTTSKAAAAASTGAASRATAVAGLIGAVAFGALAL